MVAAQVDIVIINWNSGDQLRACVASLEQFDQGEIRSIIIVDNASTDNSAELPKGDLTITLIRNADNKGFGSACNLGAVTASAPYLLFLNPDTQVFKESISGTLQFMQQPENGRIAVCGIALVDEKGQISRACGRFPGFSMFSNEMTGISHVFPKLFLTRHMRDWDHRESQAVDHVIGAFYLIRKSVFDTVGKFDERYFLYFEDFDLSFKIKKAGWEIYYLAYISAYHAGGGTSRTIRGRRLGYGLLSRAQYMIKNLPFYQSFLLIGLSILVEPIVRLVLAATEFSGTRVRETFVGFAYYYFKLFKKATWRK